MTLGPFCPGCGSYHLSGDVETCLNRQSKPPVRPATPSKPSKGLRDRLRPYEPLIGALVLALFCYGVFTYLHGQW